jgi:hypothetical protein
VYAFCIYCKTDGDSVGGVASRRTNSILGSHIELPAHAGSSLADFSTLKMEAIQSSETSVQSTTSTRRHTPEDDILHSHRRENLKSYILLH